MLDHAPPGRAVPDNAPIEPQVAEALREAARLSAALLSTHSAADVRRLAISAGGLLGGGRSAILAYDPLLPYLRIDESEGVARSLALGFAFEVSEGFVPDLFERAAAGENPPHLERALVEALGFVRPVIYPLGGPARLRGLWVADALSSEPLLPHVLRQLAAVASGAITAAESRATTERLGVLDPVTGLYDRRSAETYLHREIARARRYRDPLSLVSLDLDHFGELNEERGYQHGDRVLRDVARLLTGVASTSRETSGIALCFRESDLAARTGADSFLVLLPTTSHDGARQAAERFLGGLRQHRVQLDEQSVGVTATAAVVTYPDDGETAEELTELSARLVFEATRAGGDRVVVAAPRPPSDLRRETRQRDERVRPS